MRRARTILVILGLADLAIAGVAFMLYAVAFGSQYSGFVAWICRNIPEATPGTPAYEDVRTGVLSMLGRTSTPFFVLASTLALTGLVVLAIAWRIPRHVAHAGAS